MLTKMFNLIRYYVNLVTLLLLKLFVDVVYVR
jgi:hypothetical protein